MIEPEEYEFIRHGGSGTVHVLVLDASDGYVRPRPVSDMPDDLGIGTALGALLVRCGRSLVQSPGDDEYGAYRVSAFNDENLCRGCHRSVPEQHRHRLFEHEQGEADD